MISVRKDDGNVSRAFYGLTPRIVDQVVSKKPCTLTWMSVGTCLNFMNCRVVISFREKWLASALRSVIHIEKAPKANAIKNIPNEDTMMSKIISAFVTLTSCELPIPDSRCIDMMSALQADINKAKRRSRRVSP